MTKPEQGTKRWVVATGIPTFPKIGLERARGRSDRHGPSNARGGTKPPGGLQTLAPGARLFPKTASFARAAGASLVEAQTAKEETKALGGA